MLIFKRRSDRHAPWISRKRNLRSKIRWFTEFCNSHYLSQLATFFIDAQAKRSTVRSCHVFVLWRSDLTQEIEKKVRKNTQLVAQMGLKQQVLHLRIQHSPHLLGTIHSGVSQRMTNGNDPSAGSPTETLLRLLLPLNAQVWSTSRQMGRIIRSSNSPWTSLKRSIGSSDGRCVQRAGT